MSSSKHGKDGDEDDDDNDQDFQQAVLAQAQHLGMDPETDAEFLWYVEEK